MIRRRETPPRLLLLLMLLMVLVLVVSIEMAVVCKDAVSYMEGTCMRAHKMVVVVVVMMKNTTTTAVLLCRRVSGAGAAQGCPRRWSILRRL